VLFSGDKLLGGPQAGIIAGSKDYVAKLRKCPIYRALRADKVVIALLECALSQYLYVDGVAQLPVYKFAALKQNELLLRAKQLCSKLSAVNGLSSIAVELQSTMGGGSLPGETLASAGLALASKALSAARLAAKLRAGTTPIVSTVAEERVFIDLRTIDPEEDDLLINSIIEAIQPRT
jgi:L-seryl-tRNA(Ser) seleniumtransferase